MSVNQKKESRTEMNRRYDMLAHLDIAPQTKEAAVFKATSGSLDMPLQRRMIRLAFACLLAASAPYVEAQSDAADTDTDTDQTQQTEAIAENSAQDTESSEDTESTEDTEQAAGPATEMTVDELEQFIAQQQQALDEVREQRDQHLEKRRQVQLALAEREAELDRLESEMLILCRESQRLNVDAECD